MEVSQWNMLVGAAQEASGGGEGGEAEGKEDEKDAETLGDTEMYQQLLKEFLEMNKEAALLAATSLPKVPPPCCSSTIEGEEREEKHRQQGRPSIV